MQAAYRQQSDFRILNPYRLTGGGGLDGSPAGGDGFGSLHGLDRHLPSGQQGVQEKLDFGGGVVVVDIDRENIIFDLN